jgi:hypothetical protein
MSDDPNRLRNQPALTTASGTSWLIVGGLFSAISVAVLAVLSTLPPSGLAVAAIAVIVGLYLTMFAVRFFVDARKRRLGLIAVCFLTIAFISLSSVIAIAAVNWAAL